MMDTKKTDDSEHQLLQEAEKRYRNFLENSVQGVFQVTSAGRYLYANQSLANIFGFDSPQTLMETITDIGKQQYMRQEDRESYKAIIETHGIIRGVELRVLKKKGTPIWVSVSARAVKNDTGELLYYEGTMEDITERKRIEEALIDGEKRFRALFEQNCQFVGLLAVDGTIINMNRSALMFRGITEAEVVGKLFWETSWWSHSTALQKTLRAAIKKAARGEYVHFEGIHPARNGSHHHIETSIGPVVDEAGRIIFLVPEGRDITDRKRVEEQLTFRNIIFSTQQETSPDGILFVDKNQRIISYNQKFVTMWGLSPELVQAGDNVPVLQHIGSQPADSAAFLERVRYLYAHKKEKSHEEILLKDGRVINRHSAPMTDAKGEYLGRVWYFRDITKRKRAEEQLRLADFSIEHAGLSAIWFDRLARVIHVNTAACHGLGYTRQELLKMTAYDFDPDILSTADWNVIWEGIKSSPDYFVFERQHRRKDGTVFPVEVVCSFFDYDGKETIISFDRDITDRKQVEEEKATLMEQLLQAQKMESVGRLAGGVSHDLNNLLTPILGYGELLLNGFSDNDDRKKSVELILRAGMRARDMVHQLLAFSRKQVMAFKSVDLNNVVTGFSKLLQRAIREDIVIKIIPVTALISIQGDIGQLEQVIMNLCVNAQDAMPDGGVLTIETGLVDLDETYATMHKGVTPGRYALLTISDTGLGMNEKIKEHLFEPFFTTKEKGKGTGLGLATVYGIVKQHNGNIWVYSEPNKGTTFKIYLPVPQAFPPPATTAAQATPESPRGGETILLVEDENMVRNLARDILTHKGYKVLTAENGKKALSILHNFSGSVNLILTDVVMPEMNGKELYERAAAQYPTLKVLYMSGYTENAIAHHGVLDKDVLLIQKPFSVQALATKVREALHSQKN